MNNKKKPRYINVTLNIEEKEYVDNFKKYDKGILIFKPTHINWFIVKLPEDINIPEYQITSIKLPNYKLGSWEDTEITFHDLINHDGTTTSKNIYNNILRKKDFKIEVLLLDNTGYVLQTYEIEIDSVSSIDFDTLDYNNDEYIKPKVSFRTINFKII